MSELNGTKSALAQSMKILMAKKSFARINISDVCDGCGMNRKSFYYHFKDKYDLMNWIFYSEFINLIGSKKFKNGWDLLESVCEMFYKDQEFYKNAFKTEGQNSFREYLMESMLPIVDFIFEDIWNSIQSREIIEKTFCEAYIIAAKYWLDSGCAYSPKLLVEGARELIRRLAIKSV